MKVKYQRIQCLRCFAAVAVVFFHALGTCHKYFVGDTKLSFLAHGDYGVDLFFVISGFIIMMTTVQRETDWKVFLKRRLERIVPLYWLSTWAMFALMAYLYRGTPDVPSASYLLYSMFYATWSYGKLPIVYPGWTLEYEMAFYLLVSTAMVLPGRTWSSVIAAIAACVCGGIVANRFGINSPQLLFFTNPMYLEFALGIVIAHVILARTVPVAPTIVLVVAFGITLPSALGSEWCWRILVSGLPAGLAVFGAAWIDRRKLPLSGPGRVCAKLGDASYSIYLVQVFVISIACKALAVVIPRLPLDAAILLVAFATILIGYGVHLGIEKPVMSFIHRRDRWASRPDRANEVGRGRLDAKPNV